MIYGKPQLVILNDTTDLIGIRTLILSQLWQPSKSTLSVPDVDAEKPAIPAVAGGVILVGEQTRQSQGGMRTTWTFQGINGDGKSVAFKDRSSSLDYGFEPGFSQVSIQRHPHFQDLLKQYGGFPDNDGQNVIWPPFTPDAGSDGFSKTSNGKTNPMFGVNEYFRTEGTYRFRYASLTPPGNVLSMAGRVFSGGLPGASPALTNGRNWLALSPSYRRRGYIYEITEQYWLSGPGGWPNPVYNFRAGGNESFADQVDNTSIQPANL